MGVAAPSAGATAAALLLRDGAGPISPALQAAVDDLLARAHRAWPEVRVPDEVFLRHVAERLAPDVDPVAALSVLHAEDLYLACACARGDAVALRTFETTVLARVDAYLRSGGALPAFGDEVKQRLRERLLVAGGAGVLPRILSYNGQGPLAAWVRIAAARMAVDLRRAARREADVAAAAAVAPLAGDDPELAHLKAHHRADFEIAFAATLAALPAREATLLALHHIDGLRPEDIARLFDVSGRTVRRWLEQAARRVLDETRARVASRLGLSIAEADALMGLLRSQFDVSVRRHLRRPPPEPGGEPPR